MVVTQCPLAARTGPKVGSPRDARWATTVRVRTTEMDAAWSAQRRTRKHAAMADPVRTLHRVKLLVETRDRTVTKTTAEMGVVAGTSPTAETKGTGVTKSQSIAPP